MDASKVADIVVGGTDSTGAIIQTVYAKVGGRFAVYRTAERVMVQFADDQAVGAEQRLALSSIFALQGQINGLIDGWREHRKEHLRAKAAVFDRRVADALKLALIGAAAQAEQSMAEIKDDVLEERTSPARVDYAVVAAMAAVAAVLFACLMTSPPFRLWYDYSKESDLLWLGLGAGALGALFSVCIALRKRDMRTDLQPWENRTDAIARIVIGALAGAAIASLLAAKLVTLALGEATIPSSEENIAWLGVAAAGFISGFAERLIPDLFDKAAIGARASAGTNALAGSSRTASGATTSGASEINPLGRTGDGQTAGAAAAAPAPPPETGEDNDVDCCPADPDVQAGEGTHDVELPPASGGVEER
ncbi:MAG TPA: hypothetical protein VEX35_08975 [Allosphingosinicella sp.]|nr:hypothetical protein [Allosphingosinicella sp.]